MKISLLLLSFVTITLAGNGQITKGNWLVGGSANFSSTNVEVKTSTGIITNYQVKYSLAPNIGYFIIDKLAAGMKAGLTYDDAHYAAEVGGGYSKITWFDFGPFLRYYYLGTDKRINVFTEANYSFGVGSTHPGKATRYGYSFNAGPVVYFNSSVGIEFTIGYRSTKNTNIGIDVNNQDISTKSKSVQVGIGLQVHLER
jgi:hypothetical protein